MDAPDTTPFDKALHTKYWLRCLHFHLPTAYTPTDAQRMTLAFFILSALDLLGALHTSTTSDQRAAYVAWIYRCQHPHGGFRGFTGANAGTERGGGKWDPANVAATYFALASLAVLGDDLGRVRRRECLEWVREMQDVDGSFGEVKVGGRIEGGRDVRFCYCASAVRWMLGGGSERGKGDIDVEGLVGFVKGSQTYDGGIAKAPLHEAHAGETYCGIATLALLGRLPRKYSKGGSPKNGETAISEEFIESTIRWLVHRQTSMFQEEAENEYTIPDNETSHHQPSASPLPQVSDIQAALPTLPEASHMNPNTTEAVLPPPTHPSLFPLAASSHTAPQLSYNAPPPPSHTAPELSHAASEPSHASPSQPQPEPTTAPPTTPPSSSSSSSLLWAGFNGRCNKVADTCYSFWVGGTLSILHKTHLTSFHANRRYLLQRAQHPAIGGFGKNPGDLPDILHSYLGLAALAAMGEPELKRLDAVLCVSVGVREGVEGVRLG